jgi:hypothetical protein
MHARITWKYALPLFIAIALIYLCVYETHTGKIQQALKIRDVKHTAWNVSPAGVYTYTEILHCFITPA